MVTAAQIKVKPGPTTAGQANPALSALMDHLAAELAREYVRLMEDAVKKYPMPLSAMEKEEE